MIQTSKIIGIRLATTGLIGAGRTGVLLGKRRLSGVSQSLCLKLDPHWVTGFIDGEGSFIVSIEKSLDYKTG